MEYTIAKDTKVKKIDNVYNFKDFANLKFLEMFKENEILYAIDIILNKKYHEISEDNSLITLVINEKIKVAFLCNEEGTFLTVDKCKNEYLYYATMYLYILYKYNPFKHSRASFILNNKSYVMKDDFKMFIVSSCGFIDYMNVNFNWIEFFNSIQYADSLDLSDLDINQSQFFYSHIFRLNVNDENFDILTNELYLEWNKRTPFLMPQCKTCQCLGICGGGCALCAYENGNSIFDLDEGFCIHSKMTLEFLIWDLFDAIRKRHENNENK